MNDQVTGYKLFLNDLSGDSPVIHSDTLYSMIISALGQIELLPDEISELTFTISSAFPFYQEYYFLPLPLDFSTKLPDCTIISDFPMLFISDGLFRLYSSNAELKGISIFQSGCFLAEDQHPIHLVYPLWATISLPPYQADATLPCTLMRFKPDSGLFFLARFQSPDDRKLLNAALQFLSDEGIGKNHAAGRGWFSFEEFKFELPAQSTGSCTLISLYHPEKEDISAGTLETADIAWLKRMCNPFFKLSSETKYLFMAREGSVFKKTSSMPKGSVQKIFNVNKKLGTETPVYRFGKAFFL